LVPKKGLLALPSESTVSSVAIPIAILPFGQNRISSNPSVLKPRRDEMANQTVALMLRVSVCGGQPYLNPVMRNGKVRDKWADYKGTPTHFQKGTYALRYKQGTRLVFTTVGKALDAALMAQRRKEVEFQAASTGLLIQHTRQTAPADPKKPKTEIKEAIKKFLDDVAMRDRPATEQGYRFTLELFMAANPGLKTLEEIEREHCVGFVHYLRDKRKVVNRTISNHLTTVGTLLRFFKREMPLDGRDWPRYTQKSIIVYTEDRLGTLSWMPGHAESARRLMAFPAELRRLAAEIESRYTTI
jgi:hypothetical protein